MSLPISSVSRGRCKTLPKTAQIALISAFFVFLELDYNYTDFKQYSLHNLYLQSDTISVFILYLCTCITGSLQGMLNTPFSGKAKQGLLTAMLWDYPYQQSFTFLWDFLAVVHQAFPQLIASFLHLVFVRHLRRRESCCSKITEKQRTSKVSKLVVY